MGILRAISGSIKGTLSDQWKEIITAGSFSERTVVAPGIVKTNESGHWVNENRSSNIISNGSVIYIPEKTAAVIFSQSGIEDIVTEPGGYVYENGTASVFNKDGIKKSIIKESGKRIGFGGISAEDKRVAFVNLKELRGIKFGTRGPQVYNDIYYGTDLEIVAFGSLSVQVVDAKKFVRNFLPPNTDSYSFDDEHARDQLLSEFMESFIVAVNSLSAKYRISQLPSQASAISKQIASDDANAGSWQERFGLKIVKVGIENIQFTDESKELVHQFSKNKMNLKAYEDVSQKASNIAAQQKIAGGIDKHGLGNMGGMVFGMNMANSMGTNANMNNAGGITDAQMDNLKKLKELKDAGILSDAEFDAKKKDILGL
ncbi:SPFH domain-containing protein [Candidatus Saccharibacteria bacterium]|nr:SPFH domain-containing protein [Candidatus Saccharibacteria bacterium]